MTEYEIYTKEGIIKLTDFILTTFVLNKILIETDNNSETFAKDSYLDTILNSPCRITSKVLEKIKKKAIELQII